MDVSAELLEDLAAPLSELEADQLAAEGTPGPEILLEMLECRRRD